VRMWLVILNLVAATLVLPAMSCVEHAQIKSAMNMYVELDRTQVIDREQLQKMFPSEARNDRHDIPARFCAKRTTAWMVGYPCMVAFVLNALLIGAFSGRGSEKV